MTKKIIIPAPVIIVEDDVDDQDLIKAAFQESNIQADVKFFYNGREALTHLNTTNEETFLIISDINMPIMNGLELRKRINESEYLRRKSIPFVFLSTAARPRDVIEAYDMTVQGFFIKEPNFTEMQSILKTMIAYWLKCNHPNQVN